MSQSDALKKYIFQLEMPPFSNYLETIRDFLDGETKRCLEEIEEYRRKPGTIAPDDMPEQMAYDLAYEERQYEEHLNSRLGVVKEFENILFKSFFVSTYSFLEAKLIQYCREIEKENKNVVLSLSDIDDKGIEKAKKYHKQNLKFSFGKCKEWPSIKTYGMLRNCIAHNEGRLDDGFIIKESLRKELKKFIDQKNPNLRLDGYDIVLTKEFCKEAWKTIEEFLWLISKAEIQSKE